MRRFINVSIIFIILASATFSYAKPVNDSVDDWSQPVKGVQGRLSFEQGDKIGGKTIVRVFLELRNVSDEANPIEIFYDPNNSVKSQLLDETKKLVPQPPAAADIISIFPYKLVLPSNSTLRLDITTLGYAIASNQKFQIQLSSGAWAVDNPSTYYLEASFTAVENELTNKGLWSGVLKLPIKRILI